MKINLKEPNIDNGTDQLLVRSSNGDMAQTSKSALINEISANTDLQAVTDIGNLTNNDIVVYTNNDESLIHSKDHLTYTKKTDDVEYKTRITFELPTDTLRTYTIPDKEEDDTFAMLSDIPEGDSSTLQEVLENGNIAAFSNEATHAQFENLDGDGFARIYNTDDGFVKIEVNDGSGAKSEVSASNISSRGIELVNSSSFKGQILSTDLSLDRFYQLPDEDGTFALVENLDLQSITDAGNTTTNQISINSGDDNVGFEASGVDYSSALMPSSVSISGNGYSAQYKNTEIGFSQPDFNYGLLSYEPLTGGRSWVLPDESGTIALLSDITGGTTNLSYTASPTNGIVVSDTGTDATIPLADTTNAGLLSPSDKTKLNNTSGTNSGDNATNTTSNAYADGKVADNLTASTTVAPSKTAVNGGLALKANLSGGNTYSGVQAFGDDITLGAGMYLRNASSQNIFRLYSGSNSLPAQISNNTTTAVSTLAINNINASNTGQILELQSANTTVARVSKTGDIEVINATAGIILKDAGDATRRRITVVNGVLTVSAPL